MKLNYKSLYINIGNDKSCLFVRMSNMLLNKWREFPFLHSAVEEALFSAQQSHYSIGIIVWYELLKDVLNASNQDDSTERNIPAHDILVIRPTKESYEKLLNKFKEEAEKRCLKEWTKAGDKEKYIQSVLDNWEDFKPLLTNF